MLVAVVVSLLGLGTMSWQGLYLALVSKIVGPGVAGVAIGMTNTVAFAGVVILPPHLRRNRRSDPVLRGGLDRHGHRHRPAGASLVEGERVMCRRDDLGR